MQADNSSRSYCSASPSISRQYLSRVLTSYVRDLPDDHPRTSLDNVENKWLEEIHEQCPGVKVCLVALKCDLRESEETRQKLELRGEKPVSYEQVG